MKNLRSFFHCLRNLFRKEQLDPDLGDEFVTHLKLHIEDDSLAGMSPEQARRAVSVNPTIAPR
jgi:hypothetical protein